MSFRRLKISLCESKDVILFPLRSHFAGPNVILWPLDCKILGQDMSFCELKPNIILKVYGCHFVSLETKLGWSKDVIWWL